MASSDRRIAPSNAAAYVEFRRMDFGYGPDTPLVIGDLSLEVRRGEFFTLLGPSGCGKTTVLNILAGYETPSDGEVLVDGQRIHGPDRDRIVIFQDPDSLYPWLSAVENVEFPLRVARTPTAQRRSRAREALKLVGLQSHEAKYPTQLSGGMKQRVQLARALVLEAPILLMDEPFGALDAQTRQVLREELVQINMRTQRTILFITHDIHEAIFLADRVGVMTGGPRAYLKEIIEVDLPRPRSRGSAEFGQLYERVHQAIPDEVRRALQREDELL
jgi:NitT/TauT family transport system ATP-binding protein